MEVASYCSLFTGGTSIDCDVSVLCWVVTREALHAKLVCNQSPCVASEEGVGAMDKLGAQ